MANNKVVLGNETLIDLTGDTVASNKMLTGTTAHDASGAAISGSIQSGNVSLTLTPSNLTPSTSPNKYVPSASASLDYSSLTAEAGNVLQGMTFIGKNGVETGTSSSGSAIYSGTGTPNTKFKFNIVKVGITSSMSNVMLMYADSYSASSSSGIIHRLYHIDGTTFARTQSGNYDRKNNVSVTFGTCICTIEFTVKTASTNQFQESRTYAWVVW